MKRRLAKSGILCIFTVSVVLGACYSGHAMQSEDNGECSPSAPFPFSDLGKKCSEKASPELMSIRKADDGADIVCKLQAMKAHISGSAVSIESTSESEGKSTFEMSLSGIGRNKSYLDLSSKPAKVLCNENMARVIRPDLLEEYSVSGDGLRQDFIVEKRPEGDGLLELSLKLNGAVVRRDSAGLIISMLGSNREFAYSKLHVTDASGRVLPADFVTVSDDDFFISVDDKDAQYPICIDPTLSDANWVSMGGGAEDGLRCLRSSLRF